MAEVELDDAEILAAMAAHQEELNFKANVRRNKWLGFWAAEKLGKTVEEAEDYAADVIAADLDEEGDEAVFNLVRDDFAKAGVMESDEAIRQAMSRLLKAAIDEIKTVAAEAKAQGHDFTPPSRDSADEPA
jgi:hypothetical protein